MAETYTITCDGCGSEYEEAAGSLAMRKPDGNDVCKDCRWW